MAGSEPQDDEQWTSRPVGSASSPSDGCPPDNAPLAPPVASEQIFPRASGSPAAGQQATRDQMPGWIKFTDSAVIFSAFVPFGIWLSEVSGALTFIAVVGWVTVASMWFGHHREKQAPAAALAREQLLQGRAERQKKERRQARHLAQYERAVERTAEKETYAPPRLLDVAVQTDAGPACPGCGGTSFSPYRSGTRRAAIGGATVITGGLGGVAAWAVAGKNMLQCMTCLATYRPGASDPLILEKLREKEAERQRRNSVVPPTPPHAWEPPDPTSLVDPPPGAPPSQTPPK